MALAFPNVDLQLTTSAVAVLTAPASASMVVLKGTACNTDSASHTISLWRVPPGGSTSAGEQILDAYTISAGATIELPISGQSLNNNQSFQALADTGSVVTLSITAIQQS